ncbi:DUF3822 family protein [uncultured Kordia sp.]|uniref:DUF3822 family protein n=1 Tax=uncultured Kordia sp. TaxID=507699 RepID=UPI00261CAF25|nr:DUF3822 family protein [uncultured Kordia sp.]
MTKRRNNIDHTNFKKLSIQISLNGLSFCILHTVDNEITELRHFLFEEVTNPLQLEKEIVAIFEQEAALLDQPFESVTVSHINTLSTFVPKPLFSDKNLADYLKYNNKILPNDYMTFDVITNNDMVNVYIPYVNINNLFFEKYGAFHYKHFATILLENIFQIANVSEETTLYVHVQKEHFEIVAIQQKKLLFYNSFEYTSSEDFIYYLLFTIEQLQLNTNTLQLYFLGDIDKSDVLYTVAYTYIRHVEFLDKQYTFSFHESVSTPKNHHDFTLLTNF